VRLRDVVKQARLDASFLALRSRFRGRILAVDEAIAERWGKLAMTGIKAPAIDSLIAATALQHDLTLVTRNEVDFRFPGLMVVNPFTNE
jgi:predicted nucleic acid-binding protein